MEIIHFLVLSFFSLSSCEDNYQLDGCYDARDLEYTVFRNATQIVNDINTMTVDICVDYCKGHNTPYAFLTRGLSCKCGTVKNRDARNDFLCRTSCNGATQDDQRPCGMNSVFSGYRLIHNYHQLDGCYDARDLEYTVFRSVIQIVNDINTMTVDICVDFCKGHNSPYAFLTRGVSCTCGNVKDRDARGDISCRAVCSGATQDDKRPCGANSVASGYLLIYQSASTPTAHVKNVDASSQTVTKDGLTTTVTTPSAKLPNTVLIASTTAGSIVTIILISITVLLLRRRKANGDERDKIIKEKKNKQSDNSGATELHQNIDVRDKTRARMQTSNNNYDDAYSSTGKNVYEVLRVTTIKSDPTYDTLV